MSLQKPLEGLLRPPLEWVTSGMAIFSGFLCLIESRLFFLTVFGACPVSALLFLIAYYRARQGYRVWRYQRRLKQMPVFTMTSAQLPVSQHTLFLGKGFLWTTEHIQRLRDLDLDYNLHYKQPDQWSQVVRQTAAVWKNHSSPVLQRFAHWLTQDIVWNPFRPIPALGGQSCLHGVSETEADIAIPLSERASHLVVIGLPGMGKTRFAEILIGQDIRRGDVVIVLDPKGDVELLRRIVAEAQLAGRSEEVLIFHLGFPAVSCRYNPIGNFTRVTEVANRLSNQLPSSGDSAAFKDFGWQFINSMAMALVSMGQKPDYQQLKFYITKMDVLLEKYLAFWLPTVVVGWEEWIAHYLQVTDNASRLQAMIALVQSQSLIDNPVFDDLYHACKYDKEYFSKITASLGPLLKKLTTGQVAELLSPNYADLADHRPVIDWLQVIRNRQIVYVGLDALTDREVATAVGNAMFSDLVSVAGRIYKHGLTDGFYSTAQAEPPPPRICVHSDEFNEIIGDEFIPLLNKGRGAGFTVTAYTQTWSDVEARLKSPAKAGQVAGNFGTMVLFRCQEASTIQMFLDKLPTVPILRTLPSSGFSDTPSGEGGVMYSTYHQDQLSHTPQRLLEVNDILSLPKGQAYSLVYGGQCHKLRMPLPQPDKTADTQPDIPSFIHRVNQKTRTPLRSMHTMTSPHSLTALTPCLRGEALAKQAPVAGYLSPLRALISAPSAHYGELYTVTVYRLMELCQALPLASPLNSEASASATAPYSVLTRALSWAVAALQMRQGWLLSLPPADSEKIAQQEALWTYALFTTILFHAIPPDWATAYTVGLYQNPEKRLGTWYPVIGSLYEPQTFYRIEPTQPSPVSIDPAMLLTAWTGRLIPSIALRWLGNSDVFPVWWEALTQPATNHLQNLLCQYRQQVVEKLSSEASPTQSESSPSAPTTPPEVQSLAAPLPVVVYPTKTPMTPARQALLRLNQWLTAQQASTDPADHRFFMRVEAGLLIEEAGLQRVIAQYTVYPAVTALINALAEFLVAGKNKALLVGYRPRRMESRDSRCGIVLANPYLTEDFQRLPICEDFIPDVFAQ